jgi:predicted ribosome quality control (RQC) complex YloA/Tae2 family protein
MCQLIRGTPYTRVKILCHDVCCLPMEGLFIAKILEELEVLLPARNLGWVFPNETTAALLLEPVAKNAKPFNLVFAYRPPTPALYLNRDKLEGSAVNAFGRALDGRVKGTLERVSQLKLDRVVMLEFADAPGFVALPAVRVLFELTGRNTNMLMLEPGTGFEGRILAVAREITGDRNRFRQIRTGGKYTAPPPYEKLDPRTASDAELREKLSGKPISSWAKQLDGLGPSLAQELEYRAEKFEGAEFERGLMALRALTANPSLSSDQSLSDQARGRANEDRLTALRKALREPLEKRAKLLEKQLEDVNRAREALLEGWQAREWADTLLAFVRDVPTGISSVTLPNLYGAGEVQIPLEPTLDAAQNANKLYARARRREEVFAKLEEREPALLQTQREVLELLATLETANISKLEQLLESDSENRQAPPAVGMRFHTKNGFEVLVGRNDKENDVLTHKLAKSVDVWMHVQGYPGSHVIVRAKNREVPFTDILEAASIAAHFSKAKGSTNVPVDYTLAKSVWRPKGARAGAVYFSHQKTVFVEPGLPGRVS